VIQPGSRFLKIGRARDAFPKVIPHVIAKKQTGMDTESTIDGEYWRLPAEDLKEALAARNKQARKKQPPNIYASLQAYNKASEPQSINAHNDSYAFEWTETASRDFIFGKEALRIDPGEPYALHWPIRRGGIDREAYASYREALLDLKLIWRDAIKNALSIVEPLSSLACMFVIPADAPKWEIRAYTECALNYMGFAACSFVLEPVACSFGAGICSGCVVDMGAQCISVACVEDGMILPDSLVKLDYGGDDITSLLYQILRHHSFPYSPPTGLASPLDFDLLNDLREKFCTLDEDELQSLVYEFFVRRPGCKTMNYNFKVIEERLLAVQAMVEEGAPWLVPFERERRERGMERIMQFATGYYDLEAGEAVGKPSTTQAQAADADVEMVDVEASQAIADDSKRSEKMETKIIECKWYKCKANPFQNITEAIQHIKETHLTESSCKWSNCSCALSRLSEMSRIGHLIDHIDDEEMQASPSVQNGVVFSHVEPEPRPVEEKSVGEAVWASCMGSGGLARMLGSILLVGGLSHTPNLPSTLHTLLSSHLTSCEPDSLQLPADTPLPVVEFVGTGKDLDPAYFGWKGGAVASKLEATQETWISGEEYRNWGAKLFRERLPFYF